MHANIISEAEVSTAFRFFYGAFCTVTISTKSNKLVRKGGERFVFVKKDQKKRTWINRATGDAAFDRMVSHR